MSTHIVIRDLSGRYPEGTIIEDDRILHVFHSEGGLSLPIEKELLKYNAISGYFHKKWGNGVYFDKMIGTSGAPLAIWVKPEFTTLTWIARVKPIPGTDKMKGILRLTADSGQFSVISAGVSSVNEPIDLDSLTLDEFGGAIIHGICKLTANIEGYLGLCFYGTARGTRLLWAAVSQSR